MAGVMSSERGCSITGWSWKWGRASRGGVPSRWFVSTLMLSVLTLALDLAAAGAGDQEEGPVGTPVTRLNETMSVVLASSWCIQGKNSRRSTISSVYACG